MVVLALLLAAQDGAYLVGIGNQPCSVAMRDELSDIRRSWIGGFWSALNLLGPSKSVGKEIGPRGIVGAVEERCKRAPTETLAVALATTHTKLRQGGI